jgi:hypothetical protein
VETVETVETTKVCDRRFMITYCNSQARARCTTILALRPQPRFTSCWPCFEPSKSSGLCGLSMACAPFAVLQPLP